MLAKWAAWLENKILNHECSNCSWFYRDMPGCEIGKCDFVKRNAYEWQYCCAWRKTKKIDQN